MSRDDCRATQAAATEEEETRAGGCKTGCGCRRLRVFAYGSLMWDRWEGQFDGANEGLARLTGYRRSFCMLDPSGRWGSAERPGVVLGLVPDESGECIGVLFSFPIRQEAEVLGYLAEREGPRHPIVDGTVLQEGDARPIRVKLVVSNNEGPEYVGLLPLGLRAQMAARAVGTAGSSASYVLEAATALRRLGIDDPEVRAFSARLLEELQT